MTQQLKVADWQVWGSEDASPENHLKPTGWGSLPVVTSLGRQRKGIVKEVTNSTSYISELWLWLKDPDSTKKVEQQ